MAVNSKVRKKHVSGKKKNAGVGQGEQGRHARPKRDKVALDHPGPRDAPCPYLRLSRAPQMPFVHYAPYSPPHAYQIVSKRLSPKPPAPLPSPIRPTPPPRSI